MEIKRITASELVDFAEKAVSYYEVSIPITPWRAESQVKNPFVNPNDVLLIVAEEGRKLLGYIGILPGKAGKDTRTRLYWNSCWWVEAGSGTMVSIALLNEFMKITNKQLAFSDLSERTKQIIEKLGFAVNERKGLVFKIKSGLHPRISSGRKTDFKSRLLIFISSMGLFKLLDLFLNFLQPVGMQGIKCSKEPDIRKLWIPDSEIYSFIEKKSRNEITVPNEQYFNWWLTSRWLVKETSATKALAERYYFSSLVKNFELFLVKVKSGGQILGVALLGNREGVIKTHYLWYDKENADDFFCALCRQITDDSVNHRIITFHEEFSEYLKEKVRRKTRFKEIKRYTAISAAISGDDKKYNFQDGDGDYIFT